MSDKTWTKRIDFGDGVAVDLTVGAAGQIVAEWSGDPKKLNREKILKKYRRGRDELIAEFSRETGISVLVIDA